MNTPFMRPHDDEAHSASDLPLPREGGSPAGEAVLGAGSDLIERLRWPRGSERDLRWPATAVAALITLCIVGQAAWPIAALFRHISLNNNEGWNAYWSARALAGQPLYTDAASPITNNYTPLSFYLVGFLGRLLGDMVIAGRLLGLAGLTGCSAMVGLIVARFGEEKHWAWAAGAAFLLFSVTIAPLYVAADDPQWLAAFVQMIALWLLIQQPRPTAAQLLAACGILLLAGLLKHNQVALPLAVTGALAIHDRRALLLWLAAGVASLGVVLLLLHGLYGPAFVDQVLHHQRELHIAYIGRALATVALLTPAALIVLIHVQRLRDWRADPRLTLLALFALLAVILGVLERLGAGVSQNAHFDAIVGVMMMLGVVLIQPGDRHLASATRLALLLVAIAPVAAKAVAQLPHKATTLHELRHTDEKWREGVAYLRKLPGPVLCERLAPCYWAGKPFTLDFFNYGQKLRLSGDAWHLRDRIARREFSAIVIVHDKHYRNGDAALPDDFYRLIESRYRLERVLPDDLYLMVPSA